MGKQEDIDRVMAIQTFVSMQILVTSVMCIQQPKKHESSIFPPYLRFPGLPRPLDLQYKNRQKDPSYPRAHESHIRQAIKSQEPRSDPPQPEKRNQYQRPRTEGFPVFNTFPQEVDEEGGWLSQLGDGTGEHLDGGDDAVAGGEENTSNRNVEENGLENDDGRQCMDKVMMVEETEYDEVLTCDHTHDNRLIPEIFTFIFSSEVSHELCDEVRAGAGGRLRGEVQEDLLHRVRAEGVL